MAPKDRRAMTPGILTLVLIAAALHATWNLLAKRARGGLAFTWLTFALSTAFYLPVMAIVYARGRPHLSLIDWYFIAGNGVAHLVYFVLLRRGYAAGDLSLVYPIARGSGPLLSSCAAILLFSERPGPFGIGGLILIVLGIFLGSSGARPATADVRSRRISIAYGLATGASIAVYTLWDKYSVSTLAIAPLIYDFWGNVARTLLLAPLMVGRGAEIARAWKQSRAEAAGIALLSPLAYLLILYALAKAPVSLVAPAREISIVFGTVLGMWLFRERGGPRRIVGAGLIFAGIVGLALA